jgi:hypothetical protein
MTTALAGIALVALAIFGATQAPPPADGAKSADSSGADGPPVGRRVEIDSFTEPDKVARCIEANVSRKLPQLQVRRIGGETQDQTGYLVLTESAPAPITFGVVRVDRSDEGSHLITWLPDRSLTAAPEVIARRIVAGC